MAVVTISREFGSEGNYIGTKVAEALGYHFVFKKEIHDVFERYCDLSCFEKKHYSEMNDSFWSQFEEMKREFYGLRGWDTATGLQTRARLEALKLKGMATGLSRLRIFDL